MFKKVLLNFPLLIILFAGFMGAEPQGMTVHFSICDSLTRGAIPQVCVTGTNLNKSFTTNVLVLPSGEYDLYEKLTRKIKIMLSNNNSNFEMVKICDRAILNQKRDKFFAIMDLFIYSLQRLELPRAQEFLKKVINDGKGSCI
uniref:Uncharacterized protein n=1 Tax=candidate division WOR-3 bacterium TaxID=2052148 RepID=A0A7C4XEN0_UNCW3